MSETKKFLTINLQPGMLITYNVRNTYTGTALVISLTPVIERERLRKLCFLDVVTSKIVEDIMPMHHKFDSSICQIYDVYGTRIL